MNEHTKINSYVKAKSCPGSIFRAMSSRFKRGSERGVIRQKVRQHSFSSVRNPGARDSITRAINVTQRTEDEKKASQISTHEWNGTASSCSRETFLSLDAKCVPFSGLSRVSSFEVAAKVSPITSLFRHKGRSVKPNTRAKFVSIAQAKPRRERRTSERERERWQTRGTRDLYPKLLKSVEVTNDSLDLKMRNAGISPKHHLCTSSFAPFSSKARGFV